MDLSKELHDEFAALRKPLGKQPQTKKCKNVFISIVPFFNTQELKFSSFVVVTVPYCFCCVQTYSVSQNDSDNVLRWISLRGIKAFPMR